MELKNVKTFIKVAELQNFSKAAAELGYAQSTVTMQIKALEDELTVTLFERNGKRIRLSKAGEEFLQYAYMIQRSEAMALDHFSREGEPHGSLVVGVMETICASQYGDLFIQYMKKYPKVRLKTVVATTLEAMEGLDKGQLDLIITVDRLLKRQNWKTTHIMPTEICFFCSARHPFANRQDVPLEELTRETFLLIEEGCNYREAFERYVEEHNMHLNHVMELGYSRMIIDGVVEDLGVSLLPKFDLEGALRSKQIALFTVQDYSNQMMMQVIHNKNRWVTPAMSAFEDMAARILV